MENKEFIIQTAKKFMKGKISANVLAGFDGFVDEILHVVEQRISPTEYKRMELMQDFSRRIADAIGLSTNMEYAVQEIRLGGNGPLLANALLNAEHKIEYIGTLGKDSIHPVFQEFCDKCEKIISFLNPGSTDAIEFLDGKVMMGRIEDLEKMNFENLLKHYPKDELLSTLEKTELLVMTDWNALDGMNSIYDGFASLLGNIEKRIKVFIDLADPSKHSLEEINEAMWELASLNKQADVMLGLNENESKLVAKSLGISQDNIVLRADEIRSKLQLFGVVIHPIAGAAVAVTDDKFWLDGNVTDKPKLSTGGGDNFNAGFCNGWLAGLSARECLVTAISTSGFYVRECHSPNNNELIEFMNNWANDLLSD